MNYEELSACIKILQKKPGWFGKDDVEAKLECLETFRLKGAPSDIHALILFLRDDNDVISLRTAEVIASLSDKIRSPLSFTILRVCVNRISGSRPCDVQVL